MGTTKTCSTYFCSKVLLLQLATWMILSGSNVTDAIVNRNRLVCYYVSWSHYRQGLAHFEVQDTPVELCTHVIYAFAVLDSESLTIKQLDPFTDSNEGLDNYLHFVKLKFRNPQVKLLLGLGGWLDSRTNKYSRLVGSYAHRQKFITHAVEFLNAHSFDGIDLKWEYPAYQGPDTDKEGFSLLVMELKQALVQNNLLLTASVSGYPGIIEQGYEITSIATNLDQIHLMAYDFHGFWENQVSHHAPLFPAQGKQPEFSVDYAVRYWIERGTPKNKLILGIPFYGRSWTLAGSEALPGAPAIGAGRPGPLLKVPGTSAYFEVCLAHSHYGWPKSRINGGAFITLQNQWIGFDDMQAVRSKTEYALLKGLGGIMVWDVTMDDFRGLCGNGYNPLLSTIAATLHGNKTSNGQPSALILQNETESPTLSPLDIKVNRFITTQTSSTFIPDTAVVVRNTSPSPEINQVLTTTSLPIFNENYVSGIQILYPTVVTVWPSTEVIQSVLLQKNTNVGGDMQRTKSSHENVIHIKTRPFSHSTKSTLDFSPSLGLRTTTASVTDRNTIQSSLSKRKLSPPLIHRQEETVSPSKVFIPGNLPTNTFSKRIISPPSKTTSTKPQRILSPSIPFLTGYRVKMNATECKRIGYASDLTSCSHFYRCDNNRAFRFACPDDLHWRQELLICDWAHRKPCKLAISRSLIETLPHHNHQMQEVVFDEATMAKGHFSHFI